MYCHIRIGLDVQKTDLKRKKSGSYHVRSIRCRVWYVCTIDFQTDFDGNDPSESHVFRYSLEVGRSGEVVERQE